MGATYGIIILGIQIPPLHFDNGESRPTQPTAPKWARLTAHRPKVGKAHRLAISL